MLRAGRTLVIAVAAAAALTGCGLGPGPGTSDVTVTVTRGFGSRPIAQLTRAKVAGSETVMRLLERSLPVQTRYGGGFVESIDGQSGGSGRLDWFYYVNGIEAPQGAATTTVHKGDRIWWDLHDWSATDSIPAVVGSFPEPFLHGVGGRRLPTVLECGSDVQSACTRASAELHAVGVPVASQLLGTGSGTDSLTIDVATWSDLSGSALAALLAQGPGHSGVYARFSGGSLILLDPHGGSAQTLGADSGLIAATATSSQEPTWLVVGTDPAGAAAAAAALTPARLRDHFAVAVHGTTVLPVPLEAQS